MLGFDNIMCYLRIGVASLIDVAVELDCWLRSHWRCWSNSLAPCHLDINVLSPRTISC